VTRRNRAGAFKTGARSSLLRPVGAVALLLLFAILAASAWVFIAVSLDSGLDENDKIGPSTLTVWESALVYGAATLAAVAVFLPALVAVTFLGRPTAVEE